MDKNLKNSLEKMGKVVSQNRLALAPDEGAKDCGCDIDMSGDNLIRFMLDCMRLEHGHLSVKTEKFCTKEPHYLDGPDACKGRCKKVYSCTIDSTRTGTNLTTKRPPSNLGLPVTIYGECIDPQPAPEPSPEL